jgi:hypothetical protein
MTVGGFDKQYVTRVLMDADQYKAEIKEIAKKVREANKAEKDQATVRKAVEKQTKKLEKETQKLAKANKGLTRTWADIAAKGRIAKGIVQSLGRAFNAVMSRGAQLSKLQDANTLSIKAATEATKGYLRQVDLLKAANAATAFDLGLTEQGFAKLSRAAVIMSRRLGTDANQAIGDLMLGMARQSRKILDNLGIMVSVTKANEEYAASIGKTVKQLDDAQRKTAFMNATLKEIDRLTKGASLEVKNAGDQWEIFKNKLSDTVDEYSAAITKNKKFQIYLDEFAKSAREAGVTIGILESELTKLIRTYDAGAVSLGLFALRANLANKAMQQQYDRDFITKMNEDEKRIEALRRKRAKAGRAGGGKGKGASAGKGLKLGSTPPQFQVTQDPTFYITDQGKETGGLGGMGGVADAVIKRNQQIAQALQNTQDNLFRSIRSNFTGGILQTILPPEDFDRFIDQLAQAGVAVADFTANILDGFAGARDAMAGAMFDAIATEKSFGAALQESFHTFLSTWGKKMMLQSLEYAATALGFLALGNYVGAGKAAAASAAFGVAAAAAGLGARALAPSKKTSTSRRGVDRGLGGTSSTARGSQAPNTFVFNMNTLLPPREDEAAMMVASLSRRAGNMMAT